MCERACSLLKRDFEELKKNNYKGIQAFPVNDDMMEWQAKIKGLQHTLFQGLTYDLTMHFTPEYNDVPPVVKFKTIPFHPNVDQNSGWPCIDFLDNPSKWSTEYTLSSILLTLQVMLSNPELENPVNLDAAQVLITNKGIYRVINKRITLEPMIPVKSAHEIPEEPKKKTKLTNKISFDDYYQTWIGIATSAPSEYCKAPLPRRSSFFKGYYKLKPLKERRPGDLNLRCVAALTPLGIAKKRANRAQRDLKSQATFVVKPGTSSAADDDQSMEEWKNEGMEESPDEDIDKSYNAEDVEESWEEEVDDLVNWTNTLNVDKLDQD